MISIIVPTFREAENIPSLVAAISEELSDLDQDHELVFVDDDSRDGSEELCRELSKSHHVRIILRTGERGLSSAVLRGIQESSGEYVIVMDADLSHPPSAIPVMIARLSSFESDFVIGSRYVRGGSTDGSWGLLRKLNSRVPTLLAKPLTPVQDPMSGFFAFRRSMMPSPSTLSPIGYKIGLELLVRGDFERPSEVPIHFTDRIRGTSKLSVREQVNFLRHLRRLYQHRYPSFLAFIQGLLFCSTD